MMSHYGTHWQSVKVAAVEVQEVEDMVVVQVEEAVEGAESLDKRVMVDF